MFLNAFSIFICQHVIMIRSLSMLLKKLSDKLCTLASATQEISKCFCVKPMGLDPPTCSDWQISLAFPLIFEDKIMCVKVKITA